MLSLTGKRLTTIGLNHHPPFPGKRWRGPSLDRWSAPMRGRTFRAPCPGRSGRAAWAGQKPDHSPWPAGACEPCEPSGVPLLNVTLLASVTESQKKEEREGEKKEDDEGDDSRHGLLLTKTYNTEGIMRRKKESGFCPADNIFRCYRAKR